MTDVVVIGAGIIGSAIAYFATREGLSVHVVERGRPASGTSSRCEGNILVSDKELGPELELAKYSNRVWREDLGEYSSLWEFEAKGGIIAASRESSMTSLDGLMASQRAAGIDVTRVTSSELLELEPHINPAVLGGAYYPEDCQVQPMLAAAHLLRLAVEAGAVVSTDTAVTGFVEAPAGTTIADRRITGVRTSRGDILGDLVVNATGPFAAALGTLLGIEVPVAPRRGYVMVTEPLPPMVGHKVYAAEYVDNVGSSDAGLQMSPVVEGTPAGSILIGSSRERVGFSDEVNRAALSGMAANAAALFPFLRDTKILRFYHGFRPYCPDHLPIIGPDPRVEGLWHACGHEGAGIGLSVGTGKVLVSAMSGRTPDIDLTPFDPGRFVHAA